MKKNSHSTIKVLNKNGVPFDTVPLEKAASFVRQHRCKWISDTAIQLVIDSKDEKRMKEEVWEEAGYVCYICGKQMYPGHPELTVDHMTPKRLGGSLRKENMACCCKPCNEDKGCRTVQSYLLLLISRVWAMIVWSRVTRKEDANGEGLLQFGQEDQERKGKLRSAKEET